MKYQNRQAPEGINTTDEHPFKEFGILLTGALALIFIGTLVLGSSSAWLASKIPFSQELKITKLYKASEDNRIIKNEESGITQYLQTLADRIAEIQSLPEDMKIQIHYLDNDTINAFATLGGHVFFFKGLLEKIEDENTLTMLMAHEIAHIKYRHPIQSLGRGVVLSVFFASVTGNSHSSGILGEAGLMTTLAYNRDMERQSDQEALDTLYKLYGHLGGGDTLFKILNKERQQADSKETLELFSTHPLDQDRINAVKSYAITKGYSMTGEMTPLKYSLR